MNLSLNLSLRVAAITMLLATGWALAGPAVAQNAPPLPPPTQVPLQQQPPTQVPPQEPPPAQSMPETPQQPAPSNQYSPNELVDAGHRFFGGVSRGLAMVV